MSEKKYRRFPEVVEELKCHPPEKTNGVCSRAVEEIMALREENKALSDALKNMLGVFDTPLMRLKVDNKWTQAAIESAHKAMGYEDGQPVWER